MTRAQAIRKIRRSGYDVAVMLADIDGQDVDLMILNSSNHRRLMSWLSRDKYFMSRFIGVYNGNASYADFESDIDFAAGVGREAAKVA